MMKKNIESKAIAAIEAHPMYIEARGYPHCATELFVESTERIRKWRISEDVKDHILNKLSPETSVILVTLQTASKTPEPLSGTGKLYGFVLKPSTFELLHVDVGVWRS
jgi:hypothetical protein